MTKSNTPTPESMLQKGCSILNPLLQKHNFFWKNGDAGESSGGNFVSGVYLKNDRKLELHFRYSLGLVNYHIGEHHLEHPIYMRFLDIYDQALYPGFSIELLDAFHHLKYDLENFCLDFLAGDGKQFKFFAQEYLKNPNKFTGLNNL